MQFRNDVDNLQLLSRFVMLTENTIASQRMLGRFTDGRELYQILLYSSQSIKKENNYSQ